MVTFEEIPAVGVVEPWQDRMLDAEEIEQAAASLYRPTARMQLEALAKRLRKESDALKRVQKIQEEDGAMIDNNSNIDEKKEPDEQQGAASKVIPPSSSSSAAPPPRPLQQPAAPPVLSSSVKYTPIDRFAFDAGGYNAPFVTLYIDLPGVGRLAPRDEKISCHFTKDSLDLIVRDHSDGKSYRLFKDSLEKDIDPDKSKIVVKADKIIVKLAKVKQAGDYGGYDYWTKLTDTKKKSKPGGASSSSDPQASILNLMKDMYEDGDDNMRKIIGETMMKQQRGELGKDDPMKGFDDDL
jgi:calcyclin binding protein